MFLKFQLVNSALRPPYFCFYQLTCSVTSRARMVFLDVKSRLEYVMSDDGSQGHKKMAFPCSSALFFSFLFSIMVDQGIQNN